ncbi:MAG: energy-coupling factor ABC transporter ATP-binding protein [Betaproteobacteria bacterium]|nr:energy-coupling factor ABC transporter ATP-binding protein [Betaproteobacteria bacterium]
MKSLLKLERLRKSYGERRLLDLDGLEIEAGHAYAVTGDNGAGKSTLLRILAGLEPGDIAGFEFRGVALTHGRLPDNVRHDIVYVHQHPYLFHTALEHNIGYGLAARGIESAESRRMVEEAIAWAGVDHLRGVPPAKLSGGEKQRVALARAKVLKPHLFLLDEPTANLDGEARGQVIALIRQLVHDNGSLLIACHDRELVELPGMRRFHLENGKLVEA